MAHTVYWYQYLRVLNLISLTVVVPLTNLMVVRYTVAVEKIGLVVQIVVTTCIVVVCVGREFASLGVL